MKKRVRGAEPAAWQKLHNIFSMIKVILSSSTWRGEHNLPSRGAGTGERCLLDVSLRSIDQQVVQPLHQLYMAERERERERQRERE